jgi:hypothetical protein
MAWATLSSNDVLSEFTTSEQSALSTIIDGVTPLSSIVTRTINEIRGFILSGGYALDDDSTTIPQSLFSDAISIARWRFLVSAPQFKQLQTDERHQLYIDALAKLNLISQQELAVESPTAGTTVRTGMWNSENKLVMRTHPVPYPGTQFGPQTGTYANPNAPPDIGTVPP